MKVNNTMPKSESSSINRGESAATPSKASRNTSEKAEYNIYPSSTLDFRVSGTVHAKKTQNEKHNYHPDDSERVRGVKYRKEEVAYQLPR